MVEHPALAGRSTVRVRSWALRFMYYVYVLQSLKDNGYYIGVTKNLDRRIKEHNSGKTKSLKARRPLKLVYYEKYDTLREARRREALLKRYKGGRAFKELICHQKR